LFPFKQVKTIFNSKSFLLKNKNTILENAEQTILAESEAIANLVNFLDENFENAVNFIHNSNGRVIVTGIGKSVNIATRIVATFNSTGKPAIFMHAADAINGDLGTIQQNDVVICISKSGNTPEIKVLVPLIKNYGNKIIAITGNINSFLGLNADFALNSYVKKEACRNNLAPTTSTTAQLVIGDALAVCLLELNNFSSTDFAKYHPGGALGKKLYLRVRDLIEKNEAPQVSLNTPIKYVMNEISKKHLGTTAVINNDKIVGVITDGGLRRMLKDNTDISQLTTKDIMSENPKTIQVDAMENNNITQILVEDNPKYVGVAHLHDLLKEGIF